MVEYTNVGVELGLESHRFRDLKRWGIAKEVLNANGRFFTDRNYLCSPYSSKRYK